MRAEAQNSTKPPAHGELSYRQSQQARVSLAQPTADPQLSLSSAEANCFYQVFTHQIENTLLHGKNTLLHGKSTSLQLVLHSKKRTTCSGLMKTALNNVVLPILFKVVNNTEQVDEPELAYNQV